MGPNQPHSTAVAVVFAGMPTTRSAEDLVLDRGTSARIYNSTAWHALNTLRRGGVLLVDELDASLHPELARYIVKLFLLPQFNPNGAQLIFTTHDVSLFNNAPVRMLEPRNVWFVEKDATGRSELFCLDEFDNRAGNNNERRYLAGQFGATPDIDDALLLRYLAGPPEGVSASG